MRLLWSLFSARRQSIQHASLLLAITALLSNALGLLRNLIFYRFVDPGQLDVYFASFRVADFIFNLLIFGTVTSAVIPVLAEMIAQHKEKEAHELTNQLLAIATLFFLVLIVILAIVMPSALRLIVPGFDHARFTQAVFLSRLLLLQTVFFSWSFIVGALLNGYRRFATYALAPLFYNCAIIVGGLLAARYGITVIAVSVIVGSLLHFAIQFREVRSIGFKVRPRLKVTEPVREIGKLMLPRSISQGMSQLVLIVYTSLASGLQAGSIAIFSGMNDLQTTPTVIVGNSLATAFFPTLAGHVAKDERDETGVLFLKVLKAAFFLLIPTLVLMFVLRAQVVRLYFGIGGASWQLTEIAIQVYIMFLIGIIPASMVAILSRVFYALKDTVTPMKISLISGTVAIATAVIGIKWLGWDVAILALAESLLSLTQAALYLYILHNRSHFSFSIGSLFKPILRYSVGAVVLAFATWATLHAVAHVFSTDHTLNLLVQLLAAAAIGTLAYLGYSARISKEELRWTALKTFLSNR